MKTKRINRIKWLKITLIVMLIATVGYIGYLTNEIRISQNGERNLFRRVPEQQVIVILDEEESYAKKEFLAGIEGAGQDLNIVIQKEIVTNPLNDSEIRDAFQASIYARVDGIIVNLASNDRAESYIKASVDQGIPVVTVGNDSITSERIAYIGTNQYNLGVNIGETVLLDKEADDVLLVFDYNYLEKKGASSNNYLNGFLSVMNEVGDREIQTLFLDEGQRIEIALKALLEKKTPDYIVATDPINSLRITKTLIDLNEIGRIKIIASSDHPDLLDYVQKGTIQATAVENYRQMGTEAIEAISEWGLTGSTSAYQAMSFEIVTKETAGEFDGVE